MFLYFVSFFNFKICTNKKIIQSLVIRIQNDYIIISLHHVIITQSLLWWWLLACVIYHWSSSNWMNIEDLFWFNMERERETKKPENQKPCSCRKKSSLPYQSWLSLEQQQQQDSERKKKRITMNYVIAKKNDTIQNEWKKINFNYFFFLLLTNYKDSFFSQKTIHVCVFSSYRWAKWKNEECENIHWLNIFSKDSRQKLCCCRLW